MPNFTLFCRWFLGKTRFMYRSIALALLLCCGIVTQAKGQSPKTEPKPNVLFLAIDDLNDWLGCLGGHPQAKTPNIDSLASSGTLFTNAHCQSPLCNPSRTSLLTGRRPSSTGVYGLSPWFRNVKEFENLTTLPQHFSNSGYQTLSTGKIFHGGYGRTKKDREFQKLGPAASVGAKPKKKLVDTPAKHPLVDWGVFPHRDEDKGDYKVASWAVDQLEAAPEEPFFLSVGFFLPHVPCYATQKWFDLYPEDSLKLPATRRDDRKDTPRFSWYIHWKLPEPRLKFLEEANQWKNHVRSYLASVSFVDSQVGRVLTALEKSGKKDNTVIVLWSDHGYHIGEKEITGKNTLWEPSTRVPLMFSGPGVSSGAACREPVELLDIFPTLVDLCGLPALKGLEGLSLMPQIQSADTPRDRPAITTHNHDNHGVRSKDWRYIRYADGSEELYDMQEDPHEFTNLAKAPKYTEILAKHRAWLPRRNAKPAPGSAHRILTYDPDGKTVWEGQTIEPGTPIPEL
jgi:choline-sulfatase